MVRGKKRTAAYTDDAQSAALGSLAAASAAPVLGMIPTATTNSVNIAKQKAAQQQQKQAADPESSAGQANPLPLPLAPALSQNQQQQQPHPNLFFLSQQSQQVQLLQQQAQNPFVMQTPLQHNHQFHQHQRQQHQQQHQAMLASLRHQNHHPNTVPIHQHTLNTFFLHHQQQQQQHHHFQTRAPLVATLTAPALTPQRLQQQQQQQQTHQIPQHASNNSSNKFVPVPVAPAAAATAASSSSSSSSVPGLFSDNAPQQRQLEQEFLADPDAWSCRERQRLRGLPMDLLRLEYTAAMQNALLQRGRVTSASRAFLAVSNHVWQE